MTSSHTISTPRSGDIWQEQDPRQPRFVRVHDVSGDAVLIQAVALDNGHWTAVVNPNSGNPAPERWAQLKRFNGKRSGYALHYRTDEELT